MSLVTTKGLVSPLVIDIENITKDYVMGEEIVHALRGVSLQIRSNEYLAIMGPSGSGKSTLMNMLGCLDTPSSGRYEFNGRDVSASLDERVIADRLLRLYRELAPKLDLAIGDAADVEVAVEAGVA